MRGNGNDHHDRRGARPDTHVALSVGDAGPGRRLCGVAGPQRGEPRASPPRPCRGPGGKHCPEVEQHRHHPPPQRHGGPHRPCLPARGSGPERRALPGPEADPRGRGGGGAAGAPARDQRRDRARRHRRRREECRRPSPARPGPHLRGGDPRLATGAGRPTAAGGRGCRRPPGAERAADAARNHRRDHGGRPRTRAEPLGRGRRSTSRAAAAGSRPSSRALSGRTLSGTCPSPGRRQRGSRPLRSAACISCSPSTIGSRGIRSASSSHCRRSRRALRPLRRRNGPRRRKRRPRPGPSRDTEAGPRRRRRSPRPRRACRRSPRNGQAAKAQAPAPSSATGR